MPQPFTSETWLKVSDHEIKDDPAAQEKDEFEASMMLNRITADARRDLNNKESPVIPYNSANYLSTEKLSKEADSDNTQPKKPGSQGPK